MIAKGKTKTLVITILISLWFITGIFISLAHADKDFAIEVVDNTIEVSVGFNGSTIKIFGDRQNLNAEVVIVVEGPRKDITIWKKERVGGAWINRYYTTFRDMPIYYNYASTVSLNDQKLKRFLTEREIGHKALFASAETKKSRNIEDEKIFERAFLAQKQRDGVYFTKPAKVDFISDHLFRVSFDVPASAHTGNYKIRSLLIENGRITKEKVDILRVKQAGINALVVSIAKNRSITYALIVIFLALFSGWFASIIKVRP